MMLEVLAVNRTAVTPITVKKRLQEQAYYPFCKQAAERAEKSGSQYDRDRYGLLVQK